MPPGSMIGVKTKVLFLLHLYFLHFLFPEWQNVYVINRRSWIMQEAPPPAPLHTPTYTQFPFKKMWHAMKHPVVALHPHLKHLNPHVLFTSSAVEVTGAEKENLFHLVLLSRCMRFIMNIPHVSAWISANGIFIQGLQRSSWNSQSCAAALPVKVTKETFFLSV